MDKLVRICVCGDDGTGKSSLITSLVKDVFVTNKIQSVLPQITIPPSIGTPENVTTTIVDTSAEPHSDIHPDLCRSNKISYLELQHTQVSECLPSSQKGVQLDV